MIYDLPLSQQVYQNFWDSSSSDVKICETSIKRNKVRQSLVAWSAQWLLKNSYYLLLRMKEEANTRKTWKLVYGHKRPKLQFKRIEEKEEIKLISKWLKEEQSNDNLVLLNLHKIQFINLTYCLFEILTLCTYRHPTVIKIFLTLDLKGLNRNHNLPFLMLSPLTHTDNASNYDPHTIP